MRRWALAAALLSVGAPLASADPRPVVVELFTSQGCSSCPPADALLKELAGRDGVIALGFHVNYWDRLGWKDPLSAPGSTERQNHYARLFGRSEIYTPQMVIDGVRQVVGSNRRAVEEAIGSLSPQAEASVTFAADRRSVSISGEGAGTVTLARFIIGRSNPVARGENAGRIAIDANSVTLLTTLGAWNGVRAEFSIAPPADGEGIAILVQSANGEILGAAVLYGSSRRP
jgi:hypothetical protein